MDWESEAPQQVRDKGYSLPPGRVGGTLCLLRAIVSGKSGSDGDHICRREKPLGLQLHQLAMGYRTLLPITWLSATGVRGGAAAAGHDGMGFFERALMDTRWGKMVWFGSKDPRLFK